MVINDPDLFIMYDSLAPVGEADDETFTLNSHGLTDGDQVMFTSITGGTGLATDTVYVVDDADTNTFTLDTVAGVAVAFSTDLTASTLRRVAYLKPHVKSAALDAPTSAEDARTFGKPHASRAIAGNQQITLSCLWSAELMATLADHVGDEGDLVILPDDDGAQNITATVKFAVLPLGEVRIGTQPECELVLAVRDKITYAAS